MQWNNLLDWVDEAEVTVTMLPDESLYEALLVESVSPMLLDFMNTPLAWLESTLDLDSLHAMNNREDFAHWLEHNTRLLLQRLPADWVKVARRNHMVERLEPLLRSLLIQNQLDSRAIGVSYWKTIVQYFEQYKDSLGEDGRDLVLPITGYLESRDTRRLILLLSQQLFKADGRLLMDILGLSFTPDAAQVTPQWVTQFQPLTKATQFWLYKAMAGEGIFMILYTKKCRFARCFGCNLPDLGADESFSGAHIFDQVDDLLESTLTTDEQQSISEIVISNNGSVFDDKTMPTVALLYACVKAINNLPNLRKIILETRVEYVSEQVLKQLERTVYQEKPSVTIELAVGVEIYDIQWRNKRYSKALSDKGLAELADMLGDHKMSLRCYFMFKPLVEMTTEQAMEDIRQGIAMLETLSAQYCCPITMHINPTYVAIGTELEVAYKAGKYTPPTLDEIESLLISVGESSISLHVGLSDEGLAVSGGGFEQFAHAQTRYRLMRFNATQDFSSLMTQHLRPGESKAKSANAIEASNIIARAKL